MATAFIAFYLKMSSNTNLILPSHNLLPKVKIAHFNLSSINKENPNIKALIDKEDPDVVSFQEFTPDWEKTLVTTLNFKYPYSHKMKRVDPFGMAIFSKRAFREINTFSYKQVPNLHITLENDMSNIDIISSYIPGFYPAPNLNTEEHLDKILEQVHDSKNPVIAFGDYSMVYWSPLLTDFRNKAALNNSRRSSSLSTVNPYDHIFFNNKLECVEFNEIKDKDQNHIGISGTYQIKSRIDNPTVEN